MVMYQKERNTSRHFEVVGVGVYALASNMLVCFVCLMRLGQMWTCET